MINSPSNADLPRAVGVFGAAAVMVGIIIGSGIFKSPAEIARHLGDPRLVLLAWLVGGVLALFGALTYSELACLHPQSGGVYVFLREAYGRAVAFVFGWSYMLLVKPLAAGGIAVVFAEHALALAGRRFAGDTQAVTIAMLVVLTFINARGVSLSTGLAGVLTTLKFAALGGVVLLAAVIGKGTLANFEPGPAPGTLLAAVVPVMTAVMWTYDGWSDVGAIAGEVKDPARNLPRVFLLGTLAVTALYLAVNAAYLLILPLPAMREVTNVGPAAFETLLGPAGAVVVTIIVVFSTMGSTHGSIMTGARVTFQQSRDGLLFRFLSRISERQTPAVALWVQCLLSCVAVIFFETFDRLAGGFVFTMWIFYGLAGAAVFVLRVTQRDHPRPYRVPGYPVVPALFVLAALAMTALAIRADWKTTTLWIAVMLAGLPAYFIWRALAARA